MDSETQNAGIYVNNQAINNENRTIREQQQQGSATYVNNMQSGDTHLDGHTNIENLYVHGALHVTEQIIRKNNDTEQPQIQTDFGFINEYLDAVKETGSNVPLAVIRERQSRFLPISLIEKVETRRQHDGPIIEDATGEIEIETLFKDLRDGNECNYVGITGPAGSGKSTLAKHLGAKYLKKHNENEEPVVPILLQFRNLNTGERINGRIKWPHLVTFTDAWMELQKGGEIPEEKLHMFKEWLRKNPNRVIFIFDALDEYSDLKNLNPLTLNLSDENPVKEIIAGILSQNVLKKSKVVVTLRHESKTYLKGNIIPLRFVEMAGWPDGSVTDMVKIICGEDHQEMVLGYIDRNSHARALCSNPALCQFTVMSVLSNQINDQSDISATIVMALVIVSIFESEHFHPEGTTEYSSAKEVFKKLSLVSYDTLVVKKTQDILTEDLDNRELNHKDVLFLSSNINFKGFGRHQFIEGEEVLSFTLKLLHEVFAAIAVMYFITDGQFEKEVKRFYKNPTAVNIYKSCFGLTHKTVQEHINVLSGNLNPKRINKIKQEVKLALCKVSISGDFFVSVFRAKSISLKNWFLFIYESGDEELAKNVAKKLSSSLNFSKKVLSTLDMVAIAFIAKYEECKVKEIEFRECGLEKNHIETFVNAFRHKGLKRVDFSGNPKLVDGFYLLIDIICSSKDAACTSSNLRAEHAKMVCDKLKEPNVKMTRLDMSKNPLNEGMLYFTKDVLQNIKSDLLIRNCYTDETKLKRWEDKLKSELNAIPYKHNLRIRTTIFSCIVQGNN